MSELRSKIHLWAHKNVNETVNRKWRRSCQCWPPTFARASVRSPPRGSSTNTTCTMRPSSRQVSTNLNSAWVGRNENCCGWRKKRKGRRGSGRGGGGKGRGRRSEWISDIYCHHTALMSHVITFLLPSQIWWVMSI